MISHKTVPFIFVTLALLVSLIGCSTPVSEAPAEPASSEEQAETVEPTTEKVLKVGMLAPMTGPNAQAGNDMKHATEMAFEEIGYQVGDYKIELIWIDSQSDPEKAARAYEEAVVQKGMQVGIHNWHSSVSVACMEIAAKYKIPHFFAQGATEVVNEKVNSDLAKYGYWTTKGWPTPQKLAAGYIYALDYLMEEGLWNPETKKAAVYGEDTDWGRSYGEALRDLLLEAGWEIVTEDYYPVEQSEFLPLVNKYKEQEVSLIAGAVATPATISAFLKQIQEMDLNALVVADGLAWVGEWYELVGSASNYILDQNLLWSTQEMIDFRDKYMERYGTEPSKVGGPLVYDYSQYFIKILQQTLDEYGELTSENLYKMAQEKVWTGELTYTDGLVMAEYKYTPENKPDMELGEQYFMWPVVQYYDGDTTIIWPESWKTGDFVLP